MGRNDFSVLLEPSFDVFVEVFKQVESFQKPFRFLFGIRQRDSEVESLKGQLRMSFEPLFL